MELLATFLVALLFASIHVLGRRLDFLDTLPRSIWLSAAGGVSVAYVFVHLLPELAEHGRALSEEGGPALPLTEMLVYVMALAGLVTFYGLDHMIRRSRRAHGEHPAGIFWTHLGAFALYNLLIGYLLVHREQPDASSLVLYAVALGVHFIVNDRALRAHHGRSYDRVGRWLLAIAPVAGWELGVLTQVSQLMLSGLFAFLAGSVVLNVLKEELPEDRESRFSAFLLGATAYAAVLLLI